MQIPTYSKKLQEYLKTNNVSIYKLSKEAGMIYSTTYRIVKGEVEPKIPHAIKLIKATNGFVILDDFLPIG